MKDRILAIIREEEMTNARFAQEIGVQSSSISHITSGRNKPSIDLITKILSRFPGISAEWLLQGKGKMYKSDNVIDLNPVINQTSSAQPDLFSTPKPPVVNPVQQVQQNGEHEKAPESISEPVSSISDEIPAQYGNRSGKQVEKVIVFYSDKSFTEYRPE
jgi:DNA-binding XRE family transcriptional regulator